MSLLREMQNPLLASVLRGVDTPLHGLSVREPIVVPPDLKLFLQLLPEYPIAFDLSASLLNLS